MATLAELQAQKAALEAARFGGLLTVQSEEERITYKSDAEMAAAIAAIDRQIVALSGTGRVTTVRISSSKGL